MSELNIKTIGIRDIRTAMNEFDPLSESSRYDIRFLVRYYYQIQDDRKRAYSQLREASKRRESNVLLSYLAHNLQDVEKNIKKALDVYTDNHPIGSWMKQVYGIGPVIAAGILSHVDITKAPTSGHIESFAGFAPNIKWEKGQKRPFNMDLKVLFYHAGMSFIKHSGKDACVYGKWYLAKKQEYQNRNNNMEYKDQAAEGLKRYGKNTVAYQTCLTGKLPEAQILARARRWTIKLFISHLHAYWYEWHYGEPPAKPYAIAILGHAHHIKFGEYPDAYIKGVYDNVDIADDVKQLEEFDPTTYTSNDPHED